MADCKTVNIDRFMNATTDNKIGSSLWRGDFIFSVSLLAAGVASLAYAFPGIRRAERDYGWGTALFFLLFGVFTITMGYSRPGFGHVSFDRVAQVSSILVLGSVSMPPGLPGLRRPCIPCTACGRASRSGMS